MSHAVILVALPAEDLARFDGDVEAAVNYQMEPFDENGTMFADGSRWDWHQIGGRWSGMLAKGYDPQKDLRNYRKCTYCSGTGTRRDLVTFHKQPTPYGHPVIGEGCNACGGTGWDLKWSTEWVSDTGNIAKRSDIQESDEITAYAFLKNRKWYERERMGWFGCSVATECEIKSIKETGEEYTGRCLHTDPESGAQIVVFNEPDSESESDDRWNRLFWPRFLRDLDPETTLVVVDYHV